MGMVIITGIWIVILISIFVIGTLITQLVSTMFNKANRSKEDEVSD